MTLDPRASLSLKSEMVEGVYDAGHTAGSEALTVEWVDVGTVGVGGGSIS